MTLKYCAPWVGGFSIIAVRRWAHRVLFCCFAEKNQTLGGVETSMIPVWIAVVIAVVVLIVGLAVGAVVGYNRRKATA